MTARLHRYWFQFRDNPRESGIAFGCGVTAWTEDDAIALLLNGPFRDKPFPTVAAVAVDVDVSTLDKGHVLPNMEVPNIRGIWYPRGFTIS